MYKRQPLSLANSGIRAALGSLFTWKFCILLAVIVLSVVFYRPFCKWLCPVSYTHLDVYKRQPPDHSL